jgi:hypothetical protein
MATSSAPDRAWHRRRTSPCTRFAGRARRTSRPGCFNSDSVAAINDAILDGVDVLNYSIGGSSESTVLDSVAQAFRVASNVGVFVANSAGNSGPGASTLDHPAPWVTTVAAATFRKAYGVVQLGNGQRYLGASTTCDPATQTPLITSVARQAGEGRSEARRICASTAHSTPRS